MSNHDKIFDQIKSAAAFDESKDFAAMDKVWNRVEEKLDTKVLTKQNSVLKKLAIAASILLFISVLYQILKPETNVIVPENIIVTKPTNNDKNDIIKEDNLITTNSEIKEEKILEKQVANSDKTINENVVNAIIVEENQVVGNQTPSTKPSKNDSRWLVKNSNNARSVEHQDYDVVVIDEPKTKEAKPEKKEEPLLVIDDKVRKSSYANLDEDEIESIVELKEPLYVINGVQYSEEEMFGENPTSPYAPLSKQKIESISIIQDEKAIAMFGKKGKNGVVIIHTKDAKPALKKGK